MSRLWAVDRLCLSQCAHYFLFDCTYTGQLIPDSLSVDGSYYFFDCTCTVSVGILLYNPTLAHFRIQGTRSSSERPERTRLDSGGGVESLLVPCGRFVLISLVGPLLPCRVKPPVGRAPVERDLQFETFARCAEGAFRRHHPEARPLGPSRCEGHYRSWKKLLHVALVVLPNSRNCIVTSFRQYRHCLLRGTRARREPRHLRVENC